MSTATSSSSRSASGGGGGGGGGREPSSHEEDQEQTYTHPTSSGVGADSETASGPGLGSGLGWGIAFGQRRTYLETHEGGDVYTVAFHPEGRYLASGGADGTVAVHDVVAATCIKQFSGDHHRVCYLLL